MTPELCSLLERRLLIVTGKGGTGKTTLSAALGRLAADHGIETAVVDHKSFGKDRAAFDRAMHDVLLAHCIDLVCLAGFMRLLTPQFTALWSERMLNIHPALLPAFKGLDTHKRALEAKEFEMHYQPIVALADGHLAGHRVQ